MPSCELYVLPRRTDRGNALFGGEWKGDYTDGAFRTTSLDKGDCVTSPVTEATFEAVLTLHEFQAPEG